MAFDINFFKNFELSKTDELVVNALVEQQIITQEQIELLFKDQQKVKVNFLEEVIESGFLTKQQLESFLIQNFQVGVTNFRDVNISDELFSKLSYEMCLKEGFFPFFEDDSKIYIGLRFFLEEEQTAKISKILNTSKEIKIFFAKLEDIFNILQMSFRGEKIEDAVKALNSFNHKKSVKDPIIEFVDTLFEEALLKKASYIHFEPENNFVRIRFRVNGILQEVCLFYKEVWERVLNRIKILVKVNIAEVNKHQSGVLDLKIFGRDISLKATFSPSLYGENIVISFTEKQKEPESLEKLGISKNNISKIFKLMELSNGVVVFAGSEVREALKLLYSWAQGLNAKHSKILALDKEKEFILSNITNSLLNENINQYEDIDVLLVNPVNNHAIAKEVFDCSLKGVKVLCTLNTFDAFSTLQSLLNFGVERTILSGNLAGIIAQKSVRKLCEACKSEIKLGQEELSILRLAKTDVKKIYEHKGCHKCLQTGYNGQISICEVLTPEHEIEELIFGDLSKKVFFEELRKKGFNTLFEDLRLKILQGTTDLAELKRVLGV